MKITIYNTKGSAGKTPIAANIIFDKGFCIGTNEPNSIYEDFTPDNQLLAVNTEELFTDAKVGDVDIVFDLAGSISKHARSVTSALLMSDIVIVPIYNERKCLKSGRHTILEIQRFNKNIVVVATKLLKGRHDIFIDDDWTKSNDYLSVKKEVNNNFKGIEVLPLKFSKVFDNIFEKEKSIRQIMKTNPLATYNYKVVAQQFDDLYTFLGI